MTKTKALLIPLLIVLLNLIVKGIFLSSNSIGGDEPFSIYHAQMDIVSIIKLLSTGNNPPLYEIILHFWINVFGISEFSVRLPSLIFSCITVLFIYKIGINYFNKRIAIFSSLLFVFSNYQILFAHEARVYALFGMLTAISMFYYLELIVKDKPKPKQFILFLAVNILLIYSHYFGFFVLFIQFIYIALSKTLRIKYWKELLLSLGIIALFYLPNINVIVSRIFDSSLHGTWVKPPDGLDSIYNMLRQFTNAPVVTVTVIVVLVVSVIKHFIKEKLSKVGLAKKLVLIWFIFPFFFMFIISYWMPLFLGKYLMYISISFYLVLAIAADYLIKGGKITYIVPVTVCILFIATTKPNITNKRNVKETVQKINELKYENTLVLFCPHHFILNYAYYHDIEIFKKINTVNIYENIDNALHEHNIYGINNISDISYNKWTHIIYLDAAANFSFPNNNILDSLNQDYTLKSHSKVYEIFNIYEYSMNKKVE
jgi:uncharacterized membrane protein